MSFSHCCRSMICSKARAWPIKHLGATYVGPLLASSYTLLHAAVFLQGGAEDKVETLLFDLDGTLYPLSSGYHSHIVSRPCRWDGYLSEGRRRRWMLPHQAPQS